MTWTVDSCSLRITTSSSMDFERSNTVSPVCTTRSVLLGTHQVQIASSGFRTHEASTTTTVTHLLLRALVVQWLSLRTHKLDGVRGFETHQTLSVLMSPKEDETRRAVCHTGEAAFDLPTHSVDSSIAWVLILRPCCRLLDTNHSTVQAQLPFNGF